MKRLALLIAGVVLSALPTAAGGVPSGSAARDEGIIPGRYVVVYEEDVTHPRAATRALERSEGFNARHHFAHALEGFSAALTVGQVNSLRAEANVALVARDRRVEASGVVPLSSGDNVPTGVRRIGAATTTGTREAGSVNVAVIDSGIDLGHPDLNAVHGVNCLGGGPAQDDNGHGTHVAGTIGAENDGAGVVGVAPGTKLYAAKVLDAGGSGTVSSVICGIDWVTSTRSDADPSNDIDVANMSLGGPGPALKTCSTTSDPEHLAICRSVAAGVTYVAAAGNDAWDFDYAPVPDVPAAYPEVLTVTAMSDGDGAPGGATRPSCNSNAVDDSYAKFSNYAATSAGAAHTIAAPGECIMSTTPGGTYRTFSGTSMASPHVAGAVALCFGENGAAGPCTGMTPAQVTAKMRSYAQARPASEGFVGDPHRAFSGVYFGYLTTDGTGGEATSVDSTAPVVTSVSPANGATGVAEEATVAVAFNEEMDKASAQSAFALVKSADGSAISGNFSWSGNTMTFTPSSPLAQATSYTATLGGTAADAAGNSVGSTTTWNFKTITSVSAAPVSTKVVWGKWRSGSFAHLAVADGSSYEVNSTSKSPFGAAWYGRFTGVANSLSGLGVTYKGKLSRSCTQTLSLYRWSTSSWVDIDSRTVGTTPVLIDKVITGSLHDYVSGSSGDGEVRLRVRCQTGAAFVSSGDLMRISYSKA